MSSASTFCSNSDALGFDESEKGIFDSLKNITRLPLDSPKEGDRVVDSAAGVAGNQALGEAGRESHAAGTGKCLDLVDWFFRRTFVDISCAFSDKQCEDRPKSPAAAVNVDLIPLGTPHLEAEKAARESTGVAQGILGCHSALVVSSFFVLEYFACCCRVLCLDHALFAESGQTSRGAG